MRYVHRPYQADFLFAIIEAFAAGHKRVLGVLPTGGGKTICFKTLAESETEPTVILAHRRRLIQQASEKLEVPHGIIMPGRPETRHRLQVGSIQTIVNRAHRPFGLIVCDEAHHSISPTWRKFLDGHPDARVLGVTATPELLDGRGLDRLYDTMIVGPSCADLIADAHLAPMRVFAPLTVDMSAVRTLAGDFDAGQVAEAMDKPGLIGDAVKHYRKYCDGQPAMAFCASVAHAEHVAAEFRSDGYRSECVHGGLAHRLNDSRMSSLGRGLDVLTACDLVSEGVDIPSVSCVLLLSATQSLAKYLQWVGRGLRPAPGKSHLTVLDHAGNVIRHGMPDAAREWTLAGRKKKDKTTPPVRQCPECFASHAPAPVCPACGYIYERAAEPGQRQPEQHDGELVEVTAATFPPLKEALKSARTYDEVEAIRKARDFKPGWTRAIMAHRYGKREHTTAQDDFL